VSKLRGALVDAEASQREFIDLEQQLAEAERARAAATAACREAERRLEAAGQDDESLASRLQEVEASAAAAAQAAVEAAAAAAAERADLAAAVQRLERVSCLGGWMCCVLCMCPGVLVSVVSPCQPCV
jgi:hypothetical protein